MTRHDTQIVKLGGSLLDLPDLAARLDACRQTHMTDQAVLIVGSNVGSFHFGGRRKRPL